MHNSFSCVFISIFYMFRAAMCPSSGELIVSIRHLVYVTLYIWPFCMQVWMRLQFYPNLHTKRSSIQSDIYQMSYWYNQFSWWWAHGFPKHVENRNKHTWKITVRQVGYLQRLYRDARSTEHKIHIFSFNIFPLRVIRLVHNTYIYWNILFVVHNFGLECHYIIKFYCQNMARVFVTYLIIYIYIYTYHMN
jgi:hypothetical protein